MNSNNRSLDNTFLVDGGGLGCDALWTCQSVTTFWRNILPPFPPNTEAVY